MAGSGGGAGQAVVTIPVFVDSALRNLLMGDNTTAPYFDPVTGIASIDTATESILSFIHTAGLTSQGGNPYEGVSAFAPDELLDDVQLRLESYLEKADAVTPVTDWNTYLAEALADENSNMHATTGVNVNGMIAAIVDKAVEETTVAITAAAAQALAQTADVTADGAGESDVLIPQAAAITDAEAQDSIEAAQPVAAALLPAMTAPVNTAATAMVVAGSSAADALLAAMETLVTAEAKDMVAAGVTDAGTNLPTMEALVSAETEDMLDVGQTKAAALIAAMESAVTIESTEIITAAIAAAAAAVSDAVVTSMTAAYEARALIQHLRGVNRFAGGMADINAVNSSAFIIGMVLKEIEFSSNVTEFQTKLELTLYEKAFDGYLNVDKSNAAAYVEFVKTFAQLANTNADVYMGMLSNSERLSVANINAYMNAVGQFAQLAGTNVEAYLGTVNTFADLTKSYMAEWMNVMTTRVALYKEALNEYGREYTDYITEHMRGTMTARGFMQEDIKVITDLRHLELETASASAQLSAEINRINIVAKGEEFLTNLEYDVKSANWDMELFQMGGNVVSSYSGGNISTAGKPSRAQSALGGALSGAGYGAVAGGLPGALVGGVAGAIMGYQG